VDALVFSHLRWDFVYQRPQHLLSRFANLHRVFFWEEPEYRDISKPGLRTSRREDGLIIAVPELSHGTPEAAGWTMQQELLHELIRSEAIEQYFTWYYTPMARNFTRGLQPKAIIYDCMDELSAFRGAPPGLTSAESELFRAADLVFTGGQSLYEAKKSRHPSVHCFPSSIDAPHFAKARKQSQDPADQAAIPHPRVGYCGVIDERMDLDMLAQVASIRPDWHLVMIGPVVKITDADLPRAANIHYLGSKKYGDLPAYLSGWDIGMLPFARNESTRFISPTKTPEYLAAGLPVVSTAITDVVRPYGERKLVAIANDAAEFACAVEQLLHRDRAREAERLQVVDEFLARSSWDRTFTGMRELIIEVAAGKLEHKEVQQDESKTAKAATLLHHRMPSCEAAAD
jgi:UDP-galactopyranose mutase